MEHPIKADYNMQSDADKQRYYKDREKFYDQLERKLIQRNDSKWF